MAEQKDGSAPCLY